MTFGGGGGGGGRGGFHDVKKHCILYPTKSLIFCKSLLFFQNKARIADNLRAFITAGLLNRNPTKKVMLLCKKLF